MLTEYSRLRDGRVVRVDCAVALGKIERVWVFVGTLENVQDEALTKPGPLLPHPVQVLMREEWKQEEEAGTILMKSKSSYLVPHVVNSIYRVERRIRDIPLSHRTDRE